MEEERNKGETRILIVDDEDSIRKLLASRFEREGWSIAAAEDGTRALEAAAAFDPTIIVTDVKMPGLDGFQLMEALQSRRIGCPVVMITGHGEKESAIEAIHKGAFDYIEKPFDMNNIVLVMKRAIERERLRKDNISLMARLKKQLEVKSQLLDRATPPIGDAGPEDFFIGRSSHMQNVKTMARTMAESFLGKNDPVVLITGESGVGKEVVARYMHSIAFAAKKERPFVAINCAAFPDHLLESELFGYEKGAFTGASSRKLGLFELANDGTLFLDEIGEMDLKMQAKLLRVLQERVLRRLGGTADIPVRPHIIAATNRDLAKMVQEQTFREDLYYRLNTLPLAIAPLRSRSDDIEPLAAHFLKQFTTHRGKRLTGFSIAATQAMRSYRWPGNIRELRSVIERAAILETGPVLELSHLRQEHLHAAPTLAKNNIERGDANSMDKTAAIGTPGASQERTEEAVILNFRAPSSKSLSELRKEMDEKLVRQVLIEALTKETGNVSAVARSLRIDRANLLRLLRRFRIAPELFRNKQAS